MSYRDRVNGKSLICVHHLQYFLLNISAHLGIAMAIAAFDGRGSEIHIDNAAPDEVDPFGNPASYRR